MNTYATIGDTKTLKDKNEKVTSTGIKLFYFDLVKLILYTLYFGKQNINNIRFFMKNFHKAEFSDFFAMIWNILVSVMNVGNFIFFMILSRKYDVNTILRDNEFVDSHSLYRLYWFA